MEKQFYRRLKEKGMTVKVFGVFVFLLTVIAIEVPSTTFASCTESYYYLDVTGNANGFIEFGKYLCDSGEGELWYEGFGVTGDGGGRSSGVEAILPFATHSPPLKYFPPQVEQTWTDTGDSNGYTVDSTAVVTSVSETVEATAGTFNNCCKVEETLSYPDGYTPDQTYPVKYERWFAPGIGPVKLVMTYNDGDQVFGELTSYQNITANPDDYFPLGLDYTWTFTLDSGRSNTWVVTETNSGWETVYDQLFAQDNDIAMMRQYRDKILSKTTLGRLCTNLLYENSFSALQVLLENTALMAQAKLLIASNLNAVATVLAGQPGRIESIDAIIAFLDAYSGKAPPKLQYLAKMVKKELIKKREHGRTFLGFRPQ